jgi:hypothetical protein
MSGRSRPGKANVATRLSNAKRPEADLLTNALGAAAGAMLAGRPKLTPQDIFAALLSAYAATGAASASANAAPGQQRQARPLSSPPAGPSGRKQKRCTQCSHPPAPGLKHCKPCLKKARARTRRWEIRKAAAVIAQQQKPSRARPPSRRPNRSARVTPISAARTKANQRRPPWRKRPSPPVVAPAKRSRPKKGVRETFSGGKREVFEALNAASDGMLARYLEKLDDGSPHLQDLGRALSRATPLKTWRQAIDAITPPKAFRWRDVEARKLAMVAEAMRSALEAGGGGGELARSGLGWTGLPLPRQTDAVLERQREAEEFFDEQARGTG